MRLNHLTPSWIATGARLAPTALAALAALLITTASEIVHGGEIIHVVSKGQTLGRIAKRYRTSVEAIREVNNIRRGQPIHPGLSLVIPEKGKEADAARRAEKLRKGEDGDAPGRGGARSSAASTSAKGKQDPSGKGKKGAKKDDEAKGYAHAPKRPGFVRMVRGSEKLETQILTRHGRLVPASLAGLGRILRFYPTSEKVSVDARLATLIGMVSDHFGGRTIHVVSGYRPYTPAQYTRHSNHNVGRAMDFSVEGVPNSVLRDFCRNFRNAGVGYYPNSSFVHLDARSGKVFWIDYSRPGEAPRYDSPNASANADEAAKDVEPHPGAVDGIPTSPDTESGSNGTQEGGSEPLDKKSGNQDTEDSNPVRSGTPGQK
jgi:uncharacterized protein YcbK (DUF882 family)